MDSRRDIFQAIADPTRRDILTTLVEEPRNVNALAESEASDRQDEERDRQVRDRAAPDAPERGGREKERRSGSAVDRAEYGGEHAGSIEVEVRHVGEDAAGPSQSNRGCWQHAARPGR